jgi:hypothetical protein
VATPPDGRQPGRSSDRRDPPRPSGVSPNGADEDRLAPAEQTRIDGAVVRVSRSGRGGPALVAAVVVGAFILGLVRPWDWLAGGGASEGGPGGTELRPDGVPAGGVAAGGSGTGDGVAAPSGEPAQAATCGYPTGWRTAATSFWAGARARVWTAAVAVPATGPGDPSIPFHPIASDRVEAIGWCAPVSGPERPPLAAEATLFRLSDGVVTEVPVTRLEPAVPDALGELWAPRPPVAGEPAQWAPGRYVIRLAVPSGRYARYLGLEVGLPVAPSPTPEPSATEPPEPAQSEPARSEPAPSEATPSEAAR